MTSEGSIVFNVTITGVKLCVIRFVIETTRTVQVMNCKLIVYFWVIFRRYRVVLNFMKREITYFATVRLTFHFSCVMFFTI